MTARRRDLLLSSLRRERMRAGLRLRDVSNESGVSVSKLSEAERGLVQLTPEETGKVRAAIGENRETVVQEPVAG